MRWKEGVSQSDTLFRFCDVSGGHPVMPDTFVKYAEPAVA